jgi:thymidylate synthase (FAD)
MKIDVLSQGYVKVIEHYGSDNSILEAARQSTQNPTGVDEKADNNLRGYLWRNKHTTPFEFAGVVIEVQLPLFVARQWQRHRTFSYNEFSARYSKMQETYYLPSRRRMEGLLEQGDIHNKQAKGELNVSKGNPVELIEKMRRINNEAYSVYNELLQAGVSREMARSVLPVSWYTRMRVSGNLLNWLKFVQLRNDSHAQEEIRAYAEAVQTVLETLFPKTLELYQRYTKSGTSLSGPAWNLIREHIARSADFHAELKNLGLPQGEYRELLAALELPLENQ